MRQNPAEIYRCEASNGGESQTSNTQSKTLYGQLGRKLILLIFLGILIIFGVITSIIIVITKTKDFTTSETTTTTTTTEMTTTISSTESTELTTELMTTEINTTPEEQLLYSINLTDNTTWIRNGLTVAGGNTYGNELNKLQDPLGIYVNDDDRTIYIADRFNHRVMAWKYGAKNGRVVAGGNEEGNRIDYLKEPTDLLIDPKDDSLIICDSKNSRVVRWSRKKTIKQHILISDVDCYDIAMDNNGDLYVSDMTKHEVKRWQEGYTVGTIVAGENGKGDGLNQFNVPAYIFVDDEYSVYVADYHNHRVMKWLKDAKEGIIVAGGNGKGTRLRQLNRPSSVIVDRLGNVYVADTYNHRITRWLKDAKEGSVIIGTSEYGSQANELWCPSDLSFDRQGNLYVVDQKNHRVQKFFVVLD